MPFSLRPAVPTDVDTVIELKSRVMRDELVRVIGAWNPERSAARVREHFSPAWTRMLVVDGATVGTITLRPHEGAVWLEMFYLEPHLHGGGIGTQVLRTVMDEFAQVPLRLEVLSGARVRAFYERNGFVLVSSDGIDDVMERAVSSSSR